MRLGEAYSSIGLLKLGIVGRWGDGHWLFALRCGIRGDVLMMKVVADRDLYRVNKRL